MYLVRVFENLVRVFENSAIFQEVCFVIEVFPFLDAFGIGVARRKNDTQP